MSAAAVALVSYVLPVAISLQLRRQQRKQQARARSDPLLYSTADTTFGERSKSICIGHVLMLLCHWAARAAHVLLTKRRPFALQVPGGQAAPLLGDAPNQQAEQTALASLADVVVPAAVVALGLVVSGMALVPLLTTFREDFMLQHA